MDKRKIVLIAVFILLVISFLIFFNESKKKFAEDANMSIRDTSEIIQIKIINRTQNSHIEFFKKSNTKWLINNNLTARNEAIKILLKTLYELKMQSAVAEKLNDSLKDMLKKTGIEVTIDFEKNRRSALFIGNTAPTKNGTYMMNSTSEKVYVMYIPAFSINLGEYFNTDEKIWQTRNLLNISKENITKIIFTNYKKTENSFSLIQSQNNFYIENIENNGEQKIIETDIINWYLDNLNQLKFEKTEANPDFYFPTDNFFQPVYKLEIATKTNIQSIEIFDKATTIEGVKNIDLNNMYVKYNNQNTVYMFKFIELAPLLKTPEYLKKTEK